ncbi:MAG TPA: hypothetical protein VKE51_05335 [Vicinamibacterales bacterium]|nr:hypothetical protein [Vicinamibacterales bacterium]
MKVRITRAPREHELDGVKLDRLQPGTVREVSADLGTWLVAERYADVEMRRDVRTYDQEFLDAKGTEERVTPDPDSPRRRSGDH